MNSEKIIIGKKEYTVQLQDCPISSLRFYDENPRISSLLSNTDSPSQGDIAGLMMTMEHVQQLKDSIENNGGVIEPLLVRDNDFVVLEGNSRLAAFRMLAEDDAEKWTTVPCKVFPADIDEATIFTLIGTTHIVGRKDWEPFEQANYLYKRQRKTGMPVQEIAAELGISTKCANKLIKTIEFMINHDDLNEKHWNCYDSYLKSTPIKKMRQTEQDLDDTVAEAVKSGSIKQAKDVRLLSETAKVAVEGDDEAQKVITKIANREIGIQAGHQHIENTGKFENVIAKLRKFNADIEKAGFENQVTQLDEKDELIERIDRIIDRLNKFKASIQEG